MQLDRLEKKPRALIIWEDGRYRLPHVSLAIWRIAAEGHDPRLVQPLRELPHDVAKMRRVIVSGNKLEEVASLDGIADEFWGIISGCESIPTLGASGQNGASSINNVVDPVKGI